MKQSKHFHLIELDQHFKVENILILKPKFAVVYHTIKINIVQKKILTKII